MHEQRIGIIGGDKRQTYMADILAAKGCIVSTYKVAEEGLSERCRRAQNLEELLACSPMVIGPVPFTRGEGVIPAGEDSVAVEEFLTLAGSGTFLFAGCLTELIVRQCEGRGIKCYDYMKNERVAIYNSIATAEGTILEMLANHPANIHGSRCLITGYGRCARTLADRLQGLHGRVTICARSERDREDAATHGYQAIPFTRLYDSIHKYEYIINTVPSLVIPKEAVARVSRDSFVADIASIPGGIDFQAARKMGIPVIHALGLPGKYAPKSSAQLLADIFLSIAGA